MVCYTMKEYGGKSCIIKKYQSYQTMSSPQYPIRIYSPQSNKILLKFKENILTNYGFGFFFNHSFLKYKSSLLINTIKERNELFVLMNNLLIYNEELLVILQKIIMNENNEQDDRRRLRWLINEITINTALYLNDSLYINNSDWSLQVYFEYIDFIQPFVINTETYDCNEFRNNILSFCKNYKITIDDVAETRKEFFIFYKLLKN